MSTSRNIRLSRVVESGGINNILPDTHSISHNNPNEIISNEDNDDDNDDDILITSTNIRTNPITPTLNFNNSSQSLARRLQNQFYDQNQQSISTNNNSGDYLPNQRQITPMISIDEMPDMSVMDSLPIIYSIPNNHIQNDTNNNSNNSNTNNNNETSNGPILISSDIEDDLQEIVEVEEIDHSNNNDIEDLQSVELNEIQLNNDISDTHSDTATAGSIETSTSSIRNRMALSVDERSLRNARNTQNEYLRNLRNYRLQRTQRIPNNLDNSPNVEINLIDDDDDGENSNTNTHDNNDDNDDIQFVGERPAPDIEILSSIDNPDSTSNLNSSGFQLYTPMGSLFVPVDSPNETRRGGGRYSMTLGNQQPLPSNASALRNFSSFMRIDHHASRNQERLRQIQREANRRARDAAVSANTRRRVGGVTVADRISLRNQRRRSLDSNSSNNSNGNIERNVRPRLTHDQTSSQSSFSNSEDFRILQALSMRSNYNSNNDMLSLETIGPFDAHTILETDSSQRFFDNYTNSINSNEEIPANIMRIIQARDEHREEERILSRSKVANAERIKRSKIAQVKEQYKNEYSNDFGDESHNDVCVLCGVSLVEGIPRMYEEKNGKDEITEEKDIKDLIDEGFRLPWNFNDRYSPVEIDLSKKVYFSNCGHIYCGRCVKNIVRFKGMNVKERRIEKSKVKIELNNYENMTVEEKDLRKSSLWAPIKCVAKDCDKAFNGKKPFTEMYM